MIWLPWRPWQRHRPSSQLVSLPEPEPYPEADHDLKNPCWVCKRPIVAGDKFAWATGPGMANEVASHIDCLEGLGVPVEIVDVEDLKEFGIDPDDL